MWAATSQYGVSLSVQSFEVLHATQRPASQMGAPACLAQSLLVEHAKHRPCALQLGRSLAQSFDMAHSLDSH